MHSFSDPLLLPVTKETPGEFLKRALPLHNTEGAAYVESRGIPVEIAHEAGVKYCAKFVDRPAVVVPLRDGNNTITSVHGRYITTVRKQNKMLTFGTGNGLLSVSGGIRNDPLIIVEGLFDALSLAVCGWPACATIGRYVMWLPEVCKGRTIWLAFDSCRPAEAECARYRSLLTGSRVHRLPPPFRSKDWNTALRKHGKQITINWIKHVTDKIFKTVPPAGEPMEGA